MTILRMDWLPRMQMSDECRPGRARSATARRHAPVAATTGPLECMRAKRILVLADVENLSFSARDLGRWVRYDRLATLLSATAQEVDAHAFFSRRQGDGHLVNTFRAIGWAPHARDVQVSTHLGTVRCFANSDLNLCIVAGALLQARPYELVVVASGDGELGCELAAAIHRMNDAIVATLSVAGSTSQRLAAGGNRHIFANIELGTDCMPATAGTGSGGLVHNYDRRRSARALTR